MSQNNKVASTVSTDSIRRDMKVSIQIEALAVDVVGNGRFMVSLPAKPLTPQEIDFIEESFPNTAEQVYHLLNVENLMRAIRTGRDR